jgi:hypothetical protein
VPKPESAFYKGATRPRSWCIACERALAPGRERAEHRKAARRAYYDRPGVRARYAERWGESYRRRRDKGAIAEYRRRPRTKVLRAKYQAGWELGRTTDPARRSALLARVAECERLVREMDRRASPPDPR